VHWEQCRFKATVDECAVVDGVGTHLFALLERRAQVHSTTWDAADLSMRLEWTANALNLTNTPESSDDRWCPEDDDELSESA
jgi:hypothetical protein